MRELGGFRFEEFLARRSVEEEIAHRDGGAFRQSRLFYPEYLASGNFHDGSAGLFRRPGLEQDPAYRGDGGQGLSPETQGTDVQQVFCVLELGGSMALKGEQGIVA